MKVVLVASLAFASIQYDPEGIANVCDAVIGQYAVRLDFVQEEEFTCNCAAVSVNARSSFTVSVNDQPVIEVTELPLNVNLKVKSSPLYIVDMITLLCIAYLNVRYMIMLRLNFDINLK